MQAIAAQHITVFELSGSAAILACHTLPPYDYAPGEVRWPGLAARVAACKR